MINIGTVTGRSVGKNRDGGDDVLLLQVEISDPDDIQTVQLMTPSGEDDNPIDGSQVLILDIGTAFKAAITVQDGVTPSMATGEKKIYSVDSAGIIKAFINLLASGNIELNGNNDNAVRFNDLKTAFNELKTAFNAHLHSNPEGGNVGPAVPQSAADIDPAKVNEVLLP
jgi:hypothetical protein